MNIDGINKSSALRTPANNQGAQSAAQKNKNESLAKITDNASLSGLLPRLQNFIDAIEQSDNLYHDLKKNILNLQDGFVESLYAAIQNSGIDLDQKITLRLNNNALVLVGEHPDKGHLEEVIGKHPELASAFQEISTQSALLKDMLNIGKIIGSQSGISTYQNAMNQQITSNYQISLKGEMSHFYFASHNK